MSRQSCDTVQGNNSKQWHQIQELKVVLPTKEETEATKAKCLAHQEAKEGLGWAGGSRLLIPQGPGLLAQNSLVHSKENPVSPTAALCGGKGHPR